MRKIRILEHISLDGVIQAPGGPEEDPNGFKYGGWAGPHADPDGGEAIVAVHSEAFDLLLGRRTYDIWSGFWPKAPKRRARQHEGCGLGRHHQHLQAQRPLRTSSYHDARE